MQDYQCVEETSMVRLRYADLARKVLDAWDMTSLTRDEFQTLVPPFEAACMDYGHHDRGVHATS